LYVVVKSLGFHKVVWLGCSIGGMIGMRLALGHPDILEALVLLSTNARQDPPESKQPTPRLWQQFRDGHREDIADAAMTFVFASRTYQDRPGLVAQYRGDFVNMEDAAGMFAAALAAFERSDIGDDIERINLPTLVMMGHEDPVATPAQAAFIAARIPGAELNIIEDASHLAGIEKPLEIAELVRAFLLKAVA
jgi:pimeloyl-ACP methyl ester carboxylesterase